MLDKKDEHIAPFGVKVVETMIRLVYIYSVLVICIILPFNTLIFLLHRLNIIMEDTILLGNIL